MFALELLDEVIDETIVEIFTTQMSVTGRWFDLENAAIKSSRDKLAYANLFDQESSKKY